MGVYSIYKLAMKYIITILFAIIAHSYIFGQQSSTKYRKAIIEQYTKSVYSVTEFWHIADSLQLTIDELSDYPVIFPIKKPQRISSGFGIRKHPIYKYRIFHTGIDIPQVKGTPVHATGNGTVVRKGYNVGYGYYLEILHSGEFRSFYAHLSRTMVDIGDLVNITNQIAYVGNTGLSTRSHLHYEVRKGKRYLNPIGWCFCLMYRDNKQSPY